MSETNAAMMQDLTENEWSEVQQRFAVLKKSKYGSLWSSIVHTLQSPPPAATTTALMDRSNHTATTTATPIDAPAGRSVVATTQSSCPCCTPQTHSFLPATDRMLGATPAADWTPVLEAALEETSSLDDADGDDDDDDEESDEESKVPSSRRVLAFDNLELDDSGTAADEEEDSDEENESTDESDNGEDGSDSEDSDSDSSGGSTVVNFNNVSFRSSLAGGTGTKEDTHSMGTVSESHESPTMKVESFPTLHKSPTPLTQLQDSPPTFFECKSPVLLQPIESPLSESSPEIAPARQQKIQTIVDLMDSSSSDNDDKQQEQVDADSPKAPSAPSAPSNESNNDAIDLMSSSSEDQGKKRAVNSEKASTADKRKQPLARKRVARITIYDDSSSSDSSQDAERDGEAFQSKHFEHDGDDGDSVDDLVERTNRIAIASDDSSIEESSPEAKRPPRLQDTKKPASKTAFRRSRESIGASTFRAFDKAAFDGKLAGVKLSWSNKLRTTAGLTRLSVTRSLPKVYSAEIELSTKVIDDPHRLRSTLLHEMCHAAAWLINGVGNPPHGKCFKKWANRAMAAVPDIQVTTTHDYEIQYKYAWACTAPKCGFRIGRQSRSVDVVKQCCGRCKGTLLEIEPTDLLQSNSENNNAKNYTPRKKAPPSAYNLFVKNNSAQVRERYERQGIKVSQPEVMKECGRLWREKNANANEN
jgi:predicted SprT family Zn-dependent metalloprotease